jgi:A118 family predicted phage portal protein
MCEEFTTLTIGNSVDVKLVDNEELEKNVLDILEDNSFETLYAKFIEKVFLFGTGATIQYKDIEDKIKIDFIDATSFVPLNVDNGKFTKIATISQSYEDKKKVNTIIIHEIINEQYYVTKKVYESDDSTTGTHLGIENKSLSVDNVYMGDVPLFQVYNLPIQNSININSSLAPSVFSDCIDTIVAIDETYDSFSNEMLLGRKRIFVSNSIVSIDFNENGEKTTYFDTGNGVFQVFNGNDMETNTPIVESNMTLRIQEHKDKLNTEFQLLSIKKGLESNYFSLDKVGGAKTATEIKFMEYKTQLTKIKYQNAFIKELNKMFDGILSLMGFENIEFEVSFGYNVVLNESEKQQTLLQEYSLGLISQQEYLRQAKGMNEEQISAMLSEINGVESTEIIEEV